MSLAWKLKAIGFALWFVFLGLPGALIASLYPPATGTIIFFTVLLPSLISGFCQLANPSSREKLALVCSATHSRGALAPKSSSIPYHFITPGNGTYLPPSPPQSS